MTKKQNIEQDFIIDRLTNSIVNTISVDSFQTEISILTKADLKTVLKKMVGTLIGKLTIKIYQDKFTN